MKERKTKIGNWKLEIGNFQQLSPPFPHPIHYLGDLPNFIHMLYLFYITKLVSSASIRVGIREINRMPPGITRIIRQLAERIYADNMVSVI